MVLEEKRRKTNYQYILLVLSIVGFLWMGFFYSDTVLNSPPILQHVVQACGAVPKYTILITVRRVSLSSFLGGIVLLEKLNDIYQLSVIFCNI